MMAKTNNSSLLQDIKRSQSRQNDRMRTKMVDYKIKTRKAQEREILDTDAETQWVENVFGEVLDHIMTREGVTPSDYVGMTLDGGDLNYPLNLPIVPYHNKEHQKKLLMDKIITIQQSKRDWLMGRALEITVTTVNDVKARGRAPTSMIMTRQRLQDLMETHKVVSMYEGAEATDPTTDVLRIIARREQRRRLTLVSEAEIANQLNRTISWTWEEVLTQWCTLHPTQSILVLSQKQVEVTRHELIWKSTYTTETRRRTCGSYGTMRKTRKKNR